MNIDEIRELIHLVTETGVGELEVQRGDNRVRIRLSGDGERVREVSAMAPRAASSAPVERHVEAAAPEAAGPDPNLHTVKSPIVGTFYESSAPGSAPFVRIGEVVQPGKVLCIIESMKLMNEIECEVAGVIESKLVLNGQPVEYGEALFAIRAL